METKGNMKSKGAVPHWGTQERSTDQLCRSYTCSIACNAPFNPEGRTALDLSEIVLAHNLSRMSFVGESQFRSSPMRSAQTMGAVHPPLAAACHESHSQQEQPAEDTPVQSTRWEDSRRWEVGERASTLWPHVTNHPLNIPKQQPPCRVGKTKLGWANELDLTKKSTNAT